MSEVFIGRQPILSTDGRTVAWELLFRDGTSNHAVILDDNQATQRVVGTVLSDFGLDTLAPGVDVHLNVSRAFLAAGLHTMMPPARTVLELVDVGAVDDELTDMLRSIRYKGYRVAASTGRLGDDASALLAHVDIAKLDLRRLEVPLSRAVKDVPVDVVTIAEKVETHDERREAEQAGIRLFQGFYFQEPEVLSKKGVDASRIAMLRLLGELESAAGDLGRLQAAIEADPGLTLRLLRMTNAACFALPRSVESVRDCVMLLGTEQVRRLATVLALTSVDDKPTALATQALVRGRLAEACAAKAGVNDSAAFTTGVLSLVHALVDRPVAEVMEHLPLRTEVARAIVGREGPLGQVLRAVEGWERSEPLPLLRFISADKLAEVTVSALRWASEVETAARQTPARAGR